MVRVLYSLTLISRRCTPVLVRPLAVIVSGDEFQFSENFSMFSKSPE